MESLFLSLVLMQPITPCSFPKLRSNIPCADCYLISINNQHYFLLIYLYLMTMKTSYRKIYLFLLLLTSYSCNDLTETNMSIDIISMTKYNNRPHKLHSRLNDHRHFSETQIYIITKRQRSFINKESATFI